MDWNFTEKRLLFDKNCAMKGSLLKEHPENVFSAWSKTYFTPAIKKSPKTCEPTEKTYLAASATT